MKTLVRDLLNLPSDTVIGAVIRGESVEWTSLLRGKDGLKKTGSGKLDLPLKPAEGKDAGALAPAEGAGQAAPAVRKSELKGDVTVGLTSAQLLLRIVSLPDVPDDELRSMVQLQVDKFSPFPVETLVISHEVISRKEGKSLVLVAAAKEDVVHALGANLSTVGLALDRVDAEVLGWWQLLRDAGQVPAKGRQVVLLMGDGLPDVIVFQDGSPIVFRALGESEGLSGDDFEIETARAVSYTLMSLEMEYGCDAYAVHLWHRGEVPRGLAAKIKDECSCEVALQSLDALPPVSEGLARRAGTDEARLNLMPVSWQVDAESALFRKRMVTAAAAGIGAWVLTILLFVGGGLVLQKRMDSLKQDQARWRKQAKEVADMRRRVLTVDRYMDMSHSALECLREICLRLPPPASMSVSSFSYAKGEDIKLSGEAGAVSDIYTFKNHLDESKFFVSSTLSDVRLDQKRGKQMFNVEIKLSGGQP